MRRDSALRAASAIRRRPDGAGRGGRCCVVVFVVLYAIIIADDDAGDQTACAFRGKTTVCFCFFPFRAALSCRDDYTRSDRCHAYELGIYGFSVKGFFYRWSNRMIPPPRIQTSSVPVVIYSHDGSNAAASNGVCS